MRISQPEAGDVGAVRDVVSRSMRASYALSPEEIDAAIDEWFDGDRLATGFDGGDGAFLVATPDDTDGRTVVGYAEGRIEGDDVGVIEWLHVDPDARGAGTGTDLFRRMREELGHRGAATVRARTLSDAVEGHGFLERFDMTVVDRTTIELDGDDHAVHVYADETAIDETEGADDGIDDPGDQGRVEGADVDPDAIPDAVDTEEGTFPVDQEETMSGSEGPFLRVTRDGGELVGYYCGNCGNLVEAVGGLGRIECENCGNVHRADEWDDSYL